MKRLIILLALILLTGCGVHSSEKQYQWNNGHCTECGGELMYKSTGSKNHYICNQCGKEYTFNSIGRKE